MYTSVSNAHKEWMSIKYFKLLNSLNMTNPIITFHLEVPCNYTIVPFQTSIQLHPF